MIGAFIDRHHGADKKSETVDARKQDPLTASQHSKVGRLMAVNRGNEASDKIQV